MNYRQIFVQSLFIFCQDKNLDLNKITARSGISLNAIHGNSPFEVSNQQMEIIWNEIIQLSNNELIGLYFGKSMQLAALNIVGQIIQTSNTVRDALNHASSLIHLFTDFYAMHIEEGQDTFTISFTKNQGFDNFPISQEQLGDFLITLTIYELSGLIFQKSVPENVGLPSYSADKIKEYDFIFGCSVHWAENYALEFKKDFLKIPIITANHEIQSLLLKQVNQLQNPAAFHGSFSKKIFNYLIANSYLYTLSIEAVARNFNLSVRTLQRKLKEEDISYLQIVEEVRKSLAIYYMLNSTSSVKEISCILGYSEPSGFVRAFKKWTGKTPTDYRKPSI